MEIKPSDSSIQKTYIYANGQVLMQHDGDRDTGAKYFYLPDRLGNTRLLIDDDGNLKRSYTYEPFGQTLVDQVPGGAPYILSCD